MPESAQNFKVRFASAGLSALDAVIARLCVGCWNVNESSPAITIKEVRDHGPITEVFRNLHLEGIAGVARDQKPHPAVGQQRDFVDGGR